MKLSRLHKLHARHGAKFIDYNGWRMPSHYDGWGAIKEHRHVRQHAGLFDVSHMTPIRVSGPGMEAFMSTVTVADVANLPPGTGVPTFLPREDGSVQDTALLLNAGDHFLFNAHAGRLIEGLTRLRRVADASREAGHAWMGCVRRR